MRSATPAPGGYDPKRQNADGNASTQSSPGGQDLKRPSPGGQTEGFIPKGAQLSVAAIIVDGDSFLLARRSGEGSMKGRWELPGGKCEDGEDAEQALLRELQEELGFRFRIGAVLAQTQFVHRDRTRFVQALMVDLHAPGQPFSDADSLLGSIALHPEHSEIGFFTKKTMPAVADMVDSDFRLLCSYLGL